MWYTNVFLSLSLCLNFFCVPPVLSLRRSQLTRHVVGDRWLLNLTSTSRKIQMDHWPRGLRRWVPARWSCPMWWRWSLSSAPDHRRTHRYRLGKVGTTVNTTAKVVNKWKAYSLIGLQKVSVINTYVYSQSLFCVQATVTKDTGTLTSPTAPQVVHRWMTSCTVPSCLTHPTCPTAWWHKTSHCPTTCPTQWVLPLFIPHLYPLHLHLVSVLFALQSPRTFLLPMCLTNVLCKNERKKTVCVRSCRLKENWNVPT